MTADYNDILERFWPGQERGFRDVGDFATLIWPKTNTLPAPTLEQVEARRAETEALMLAEALEREFRERLLANAGLFLNALDTLAHAVSDLQAKVVGLEPGIESRVRELRDDIAAFKDG